MATHWILKSEQAAGGAASSGLSWLALRRKNGILVLAAGLSLGLYLDAAAWRFHYAGRPALLPALIPVLTVLVSLAAWILISQTLVARRGLAAHEVARKASFPFSAFLILTLAAVEFRLFQPSPARVLTTLALVFLAFIVQMVWLFSPAVPVLVDALERRAAYLLQLLVVTYGLLTFALTMASYRNFKQPDFNPDSAYYHQVFWNTTQGRFFQGSLWQERSYRPPARNSFALHNSPILIPLAALYALYPTYGTLMAFKTAAIVLCAIPLFLLARRKADATAGLIVAGAFLLYPTVVYQSFGAFHEILFAGFPLLLAFYFFEAGRFIPFIACCVGALLAREDVGLTTAVFGVFAWMRRMDWKWVAVPLGLSLGWYFFSVLVLMPAISPSSGQRLVALFAPFGSSYGEIARHMVWHPGRTVSALFTPLNTGYLLRLLEPVGPLSLASPINLFLAPGLLVNLLASRGSPPVGDISYHYSFLLCGLLFVGLIYNLRRLERLSSRFAVEARVWRPALLMVTFLLLPIAFKDLVIYSPVREIFDARRRPAAEHALRLIPARAAVAAPAKLLTRLSSRERLYAVDWMADYPDPVLDYVILDTKSQSYESTSEGYRHFTERVRTGGQYTLLFSEDGLEVYCRTAGTRSWKPETSAGGAGESIKPRVERSETLGRSGPLKHKPTTWASDRRADGILSPVSRAAEFLAPATQGSAALHPGLYAFAGSAGWCLGLIT